MCGSGSHGSREGEGGKREGGEKGTRGAGLEDEWKHEVKSLLSIFVYLAYYLTYITCLFYLLYTYPQVYISCCRGSRSGRWSGGGDLFFSPVHHYLTSSQSSLSPLSLSHRCHVSPSFVLALQNSLAILAYPSM